MQRTRVQFNGQMVEAEVLEFRPTASGEPWTEYELSDGTRTRLRTTLTRGLRIIDQRGPDGSPIYMYEQNTIITTQVGPHLMEGGS